MSFFPDVGRKYFSTRTAVLHCRIAPRLFCGQVPSFDWRFFFSMNMFRPGVRTHCYISRMCVTSWVVPSTPVVLRNTRAPILHWMMIEAQHLRRPTTMSNLTSVFGLFENFKPLCTSTPIVRPSLKLHRERVYRTKQASPHSFPTYPLLLTV